MKNIPKVSVLIPAYNAMPYLEAALSSVLNQTFTDYEVIVINDGSTDNIEEWMTQVSDSRVQLVSQPNLGVSQTRNNGIKKSRGEYLAFLDADDLWESTKLAKQVQVLNNHPEVGLVYTGVAYVDEKGNSTGRVVKYRQEGHVWQELTKGNLVECGSVAMVRRQCFEECGVFDTAVAPCEDWDMWLRIAKAYPFKVIEEPLVYYRQVN